MCGERLELRQLLGAQWHSKSSPAKDRPFFAKPASWTPFWTWECVNTTIPPHTGFARVSLFSFTRCFLRYALKQQAVSVGSRVPLLELLSQQLHGELHLERYRHLEENAIVKVLELMSYIQLRKLCGLRDCKADGCDMATFAAKPTRPAIQRTRILQDVVSEKSIVSWLFHME